MKNMKKIFCLILACLMLCGCVLPLSSCVRNAGEEIFPGGTEEEAEPCEHEYEADVLFDVTRMKDGIIRHTCKKCGDSYLEIVPAERPIAEADNFAEFVELYTEDFNYSYNIRENTVIDCGGLYALFHKGDFHALCVDGKLAAVIDLDVDLILPSEDDEEEVEETPEEDPEPVRYIVKFYLNGEDVYIYVVADDAVLMERYICLSDLFTDEINAEFGTELTSDELMAIIKKLDTASRKVSAIAKFIETEPEAFTLLAEGLIGLIRFPEPDLSQLFSIVCYETGNVSVTFLEKGLSASLTSFGNQTIADLINRAYDDPAAVGAVHMSEQLLNFIDNIPDMTVGELVDAIVAFSETTGISGEKAFELCDALGAILFGNEFTIEDLLWTSESQKLCLYLGYDGESSYTEWKETEWTAKYRNAVEELFSYTVADLFDMAAGLADSETPYTFDKLIAEAEKYEKNLQKFTIVLDHENEIIGADVEALMDGYTAVFSMDRETGIEFTLTDSEAETPYDMISYVELPNGDLELICKDAADDGTVFTVLSLAVTAGEDPEDEPSVDFALRESLSVGDEDPVSYIYEVVTYSSHPETGKTLTLYDFDTVEYVNTVKLCATFADDTLTVQYYEKDDEEECDCYLSTVTLTAEALNYVKTAKNYSLNGTPTDIDMVKMKIAGVAVPPETEDEETTYSFNEFHLEEYVVKAGKRDLTDPFNPVTSNYQPVKKLEIDAKDGELNFASYEFDYEYEDPDERKGTLAFYNDVIGTTEDNVLTVLLQEATSEFVYNDKGEKTGAKLKVEPISEFRVSAEEFRYRKLRIYTDYTDQVYDKTGSDRMFRGTKDTPRSQAEPQSELIIRKDHIEYTKYKNFETRTYDLTDSATTLYDEVARTVYQLTPATKLSLQMKENWTTALDADASFAGTVAGFFAGIGEIRYESYDWFSSENKTVYEMKDNLAYRSTYDMTYVPYVEDSLVYIAGEGITFTMGSYYTASVTDKLLTEKAADENDLVEVTTVCKPYDHIHFTLGIEGAGATPTLDGYVAEEVTTYYDIRDGGLLFESESIYKLVEISTDKITHQMRAHFTYQRNIGSALQVYEIYDAGTVVLTPWTSLVGSVNIGGFGAKMNIQLDRDDATDTYTLKDSFLCVIVNNVDYTLSFTVADPGVKYHLNFTMFASFMPEDSQYIAVFDMDVDLENKTVTLRDRTDGTDIVYVNLTWAETENGCSFEYRDSFLLNPILNILGLFGPDVSSNRYKMDPYGDGEGPDGYYSIIRAEQFTDPETGDSFAELLLEANTPQRDGVISGAQYGSTEALRIRIRAEYGADAFDLYLIADDETTRLIHLDRGTSEAGSLAANASINLDRLLGLNLDFNLLISSVEDGSVITLVTPFGSFAIHAAATDAGTALTLNIDDDTDLILTFLDNGGIRFDAVMTAPAEIAGNQEATFSFAYVNGHFEVIGFLNGLADVNAVFVPDLHSGEPMPSYDDVFGGLEGLFEETED